MIRVRLGGAKRYRLVLSAVGGAVGILLFAGVLLVTGDWRAGGLAALCAVQLVHSLVLLGRLKQPVAVDAGGSWSSDRAAVFMTLATCYRNTRSVRGLFVAGDGTAAFVPLEAWSNALVSVFVSTFGQRCQIVDVSLNPHDLSEAALRAFTASNRGHMLGSDWQWAASKQLVSPTSRWNLVLDVMPSPPIEDGWEWAPAPTAEELGSRLRKVARAGAVASLGCVGIGAMIAWWVGDLDPLIGGLGYALLVLVAFIVAAFVVNRSRASGGSVPGPGMER